MRPIGGATVGEEKMPRRLACASTRRKISRRLPAPSSSSRSKTIRSDATVVAQLAARRKHFSSTRLCRSVTLLFVYFSAQHVLATQSRFQQQHRQQQQLHLRRHPTLTVVASSSLDDYDLSGSEAARRLYLRLNQQEEEEEEETTAATSTEVISASTASASAPTLVGSWPTNNNHSSATGGDEKKLTANFPASLLFENAENGRAASTIAADNTPAKSSGVKVSEEEEEDEEEVGDEDGADGIRAEPKVLRIVEKLLMNMLTIDGVRNDSYSPVLKSQFRYGNGYQQGYRPTKPIISAVFTTTTSIASSSVAPYSQPSQLYNGHHDRSAASLSAGGSSGGGGGVVDMLSEAAAALGEELSSSTVIPILIVGILFSFATTAGNLMVMISIRLDRQLQTISNYFLFSLAVADITIGIISIPLMTYYTAMQYWGIGYAACQFWLSVDYLMSNASVLNLLLISFDRYFSVTRPLSYRPRRTTKKALIMIAFTYLISLLIWPPWIIGWPYIEGKITVETGTCVVQFLVLSGNNWASQFATIGTAIAAFYLPVSIMIYLYYRVFKETKRRQKELKSLQAGQVRGMGMRMMPPSGGGSFTVPSSTGQSFSGQTGGGCERAGGGGGQPPHTAGGGISAQPSVNSNTIDMRKQFLPFLTGTVSGPMPPSLRRKKKFTWLRYCSGRSVTTELSSEEESSDVVMPVEDTSLGSSVPSNSLRSKSKRSQLDAAEEGFRHQQFPTSSPPASSIPRSLKMDRPMENGGVGSTCSRFRRRIDADCAATSTSAVTPPPIVFHAADGDESEAEVVNSRKAEEPPPLRSYKVLIEYCQDEGKRPSVRLSSAVVTSTNDERPESRASPTDSVASSTNTPKRSVTSPAGSASPKGASLGASMIPASRASTKLSNGSAHSYTRSNSHETPAATSTITATAHAPVAGKWSMPASGVFSDADGLQNGKQSAHAFTTSSSLQDEFMRKSEKERRKNERRQESKAAKTLSAILFAFIVTWTPYNVIVCWETFFPNSVPDLLFTISYCLCYVNSTINPLCYALCNARFRMTYMRILRCKRWKKVDSSAAVNATSALYRHAYLRRT